MFGMAAMVYQRSSAGMKSRINIHRVMIPALVILAVMSLADWNSAQSQNQSPANADAKDDGQIIRCPMGFISWVEINVTDRQGHEAAGLKMDDFTIYENGVKQKIDHWEANTGPERKPDQAMYEAGYYAPDYPFKGEWRKIRVVLRGHGQEKLKVTFTPKGYYARPELRK
jgi:hypothetical protein